MPRKTRINVLTLALISALALVLTACSTPPPETTSNLTVTIGGLPGGAQADVSVFGPNNFSETLTASETLSGLKPGDYDVIAVDVTHDDTIYSATASESSVSVAAESTASLDVTYQEEATAEPDTGSHDDQLALVAEQLPDFGGLFFDDDGVLNVFLLDASPNREPEAIKALLAVFGDDILRRGLRVERDEDGGVVPQFDTQQTTTIKLIQGTFDIPELLRRYEEMDSVLGIEGVVFTDLDEASNRLAVGVEDREALQRVQAALDNLGIPRDMVLIELAEAEVLASHTVRSSFRPTLGGIQIQNASGTCTLGFNAFRSGIRGFVTNSHCTLIQGGVEATAFYQPTFSGANLIGIETADPTYKLGLLPFGSFVHGFWCPPLKRCRVSDSAFASYTSGVSSSLGRVARVTGVGTTGGGSGSITINHSNPTYTIVSKTAYPLVGEWLDKIGRTTGHTYGKVIKTCQRRNISGTNITLLCQDRVKAGHAPGDSGSPVFKWSAGGNISLYGVLYGGNSAGTEFGFSAMWNIQKDLGTLVTH